MSTQQLYTDIRQVVRDFTQGTTSRALAGQQFVDLLHEVDQAARKGDLSKIDKNRHMVLLLQHLSLVLHSPGTNWYRKLLGRGNLMLNAPPVLVMTGLDFSALSLPRFDLSRVMLIACNFDESDLRGARFVNCQLQGCSFRRADLSGGDFRKTTLYGCGFEDANTRNVRGLG